MLIGENVWVTVKYRLFDSEGTEIEEDERELTYLQGGYGAVFPRIEEALAGQGVGYVTSVYLQPDESFGDYEASRVVLLPRSSLPDEIEVGMTFESLPGAESDDEEDLYVVTNISDDAVVLDGNHPLAGMALRFDLRVTGVRTASHEEVEHERENARLMAADDDEDEDEGDDEIEAADGEREGEPDESGESHRRRLH